MLHVQHPFDTCFAKQYCNDLWHVDKAACGQFILLRSDKDSEYVLQVMCITLQLLQKLVCSADLVGEALVPYYRQILPIFNLYKNNNKNLGDSIDYAQKQYTCLGELISDTLALFEQKGGEDAFINIKYMVPTYESCVNYA